MLFFLDLYVCISCTFCRSLHRPQEVVLRPYYVDTHLHSPHCFLALSLLITHITCPDTWLSPFSRCSSSCAASLGAVPCMLTAVLAASSPHLLSSCIFLSPFLLKEASCAASFLLMWTLLLYSPCLVLSLYYWRLSEISVALYLIARSWFFVFSLIPAISLYFIVFCTAELFYVNLLHFRFEG